MMIRRVVGFSWILLGILIFSIPSARAAKKGNSSQPLFPIYQCSFGTHDGQKVTGKVSFSKEEIEQYNKQRKQDSPANSCAICSLSGITELVSPQEPHWKVKMFKTYFYLDSFKLEISFTDKDDNVVSHHKIDTSAGLIEMEWPAQNIELQCRSNLSRFPAVSH